MNACASFYSAGNRFWRRSLPIFVSLTIAVAVFPADLGPPFGAWTRASERPILSPQGEGFESAGVFNPTVVKKDGSFVMLYRAQDHHGTSSLGYATSQDGIHFERHAAPVMTAQEPYEKGGGVEDPRLQKFGDLYYLTYTGYNNVDGVGPRHLDAQLCLATSKDLIHWERKGVILPAYKGKWNTNWTKSGAMVPERIHGKYWMYYLGDARGPNPQMGIASSDDLLHWTDALDRPVLANRKAMFDARVVEPGPAPLITRDGIFLTYNGAGEDGLYATGWALFDKNDPTRVLARSDAPIFSPKLEWEKVGQVPNVVFVEGLVREPDRWLFYYGGADKYIGVASAPVPNPDWH
jgi:beta-1,2-mannosidase